MIAVATNLRAQVLLMPIIKDQVIVVLLLSPAPGVECFIHHHHAHSIAKIKHLGRRLIMAGAQRIDAHLFHDFELTFQGSNVDCRSQRAKIMVIANSVEPHVLAVKKETVGDIKLDCPNAENSFLTVYEFAVLLDSSDGGVKIGFFYAPELRVFDGYGKGDRFVGNG